VIVTSFPKFSVKSLNFIIIVDVSDVLLEVAWLLCSSERKCLSNT
jgi:hypothetical protein